MNSSMEDGIQVNIGYQQLPLLENNNNYSFDNSSTDDDDDEQGSDCESCVTRSDEGDQFEELLFDDGLIRLDEDEIVHKAVKHKFLSNLGDFAKNTTIVAIHKKNWTDLQTGKAKLRCFEVFARALAKECQVVANLIKYAWYGGSKEDIARIMSHGFGHQVYDHNQINYGHGVCLSSVDSPAQSVQSCVIDNDGLRHLLLCRVLLENTDYVDCGSSQFHPSSEGFDSKVDVHARNKHIIWSAKLNTHILPEYVISFRAPSYLGGLSNTIRMLKKPTSPWISFQTLFSALFKILPQPKSYLIHKYHKDYKNRKFSRRELIEKLRELAGDDLLMKIIKSSGAKR